MSKYEQFLHWPTHAHVVMEVRPAESDISETFVQYSIDDVRVCRDDFLAFLELQKVGELK